MRAPPCCLCRLIAERVRAIAGGSVAAAAGGGGSNCGLRSPRTRTDRLRPDGTSCSGRLQSRGPAQAEGRRVWGLQARCARAQDTGSACCLADDQFILLAVPAATQPALACSEALFAGQTFDVQKGRAVDVSKCCPVYTTRGEGRSAPLSARHLALVTHASLCCLLPVLPVCPLKLPNGQMGLQGKRDAKA